MVELNEDDDWNAIDLDDHRVAVLALTGLPAAGKSTVSSMVRDLGVPCKDTGEAVREEAQDRYDEPDEDDVWETAEDLRAEHGPAGPTIVAEDWIKQCVANGHEVICISSMREQAEADWLRDNVGATLVARIEADDYARQQRYIDMKLDDEDVESISREREQELLRELYEREYREMPYPDHDVVIKNQDSVSMRTVMERLEHLICVME